MATHTIYQGEDCAVTISDIVDGAKQPLDVTGWTVHAMARPSATSATLWAEWVSGTPTGSQGQATAAGSVVTLTVPAAMSSAWTWVRRTAELQVEIVEPGGARTARVADASVYLDPEAVRP